MKHALFLLTLALAPCAAMLAAERPNIVYIMADDLGWGDLGVHRGSIPTPRIDRLFHEGVELRQFMGWAVCSPTRAMLLTGRHPFRVGTGPEVGGELAKEETTIAEGFKASGYRTGVFGKWHNGGDPDTPEYRRAFEEAWKSMKNKKLGDGGLGANEHGFDEAWVYYDGGADYFTRRTVGGRGPVSWWHNRTYLPDETGYTDDLVTQRAVEFIRASKDQPFFCYVPFHIVHGPHQAKDSDLAAVDPAITDPDKRVYAAMVMSMDRNVAAILAELDRLSLSDNTIVVFTSDNGATTKGSNLPFRGGKHSVYEGGVRLPTAIRWPKGGLSGGRSWNGLCGACDMFPTLMAMAGCPMPPTRPLDGKDVWPALRDNAPSPVDSYYWVWHERDTLRTARWRLHRFTENCELYDIQADEGETTDVSAANPEVVKELTAKMDAWATSLGAALSHRPAPARLHTAPAPAGEVLEVSVTVTAEAKAKDRLAVPIAGWSGSQQATDWVEFDIASAPDALSQGFFYSPGKGSNPMEPFFRKNEGVDQFGRAQAAGPGTKDGPGTWEHRIVGLCAPAPGPLGQHALMFAGGKAGTYKVYLDNLRLRRADGSAASIWSEGKDTRSQRQFELPAGFTNLKIRSIPVSEVPTR